MRIPLVGGWEEDPAWARIYPLLVEHPLLGAPLWRFGLDTDIRRLYEAVREVGAQPVGARVLDVPAGGGVALRGLLQGGGLDYVAADISATMLARTEASALRHGVADQVTTVLADVADLPFEDDAFDMVVSFTGLHVFPDPCRAIHEMVRTLRSGGVLTGSAMFTGDFRGLRRRYGLVHAAGRLTQVLGPMCTAVEARTWIIEAGASEVHVEMSGGLGYFRAVKDI